MKVYQHTKNPITFTNNTSYQTNVSLIRNNLTLSKQVENVELNNIFLSVTGMTDSGPKGITYSFNPQKIDLNENNQENSLLTLMMVNEDVIESENNTLMIIANIFKNNLTTSILQPLPISIIKSDDSSAGSSSSSSSSSSSTLEETNANYNSFNTQNSSILSQLNFIDIIKNLSLAIAVILIGFIIYKRIKNRDITKKNNYSN